MNHLLRDRGILLTLISTIGFSTYPILGKYVFSGGANLATTLFVRFTLAALVFWIIAYRLEGTPKLNARLWITLILLGAIGYASMSGLYLTASKFISTSLAALIFYTYPMIVAILSVVTKQESFSKSKITGLLISSTGLILVLGLNLKGVSIIGILLALAASITYSIYILTSNYVLKEISPLFCAAVISSSAAASYGLFGATMGFTWHLPSTTWFGILGIALFCSILAMLTFFYGVKVIGPTSASVISSLEPIMTIAFAALLFGERLTLLQSLGGILVVLGGMATVFNSEQKPSPLLESANQPSCTDFKNLF